MEKIEYVIICDSMPSSTRYGADVFYGCKKCHGILPCRPATIFSCGCGNIGFDNFKLWIGDWTQVVALKKTQDVSEQKRVIGKWQYEVIVDGLNDTEEIPSGEGIFYGCKKCETVIPLTGSYNQCGCENISITKQTTVKDPGQMLILREIKS